MAGNLIDPKIWEREIKKQYEQEIEREILRKPKMSPYKTPPYMEDRIKVNATPQLNFDSNTLIVRLLGGSERYEVQTRMERWLVDDTYVLHVALKSKADGQIVRFEEDPNKFPSDMLIDKLRLLR